MSDDGSFMGIPDNLQLRDLLATMPLFAGVSLRHLRDIAGSARRTELLKDEMIYRVGESAREVFFLISGQAKRATFSAGGTEKVLELLLPGQSFGEAELFSSRPYASFAVAVEPTVLLHVGGDSIRRLLETDPHLSSRVIGRLARRALDVEGDTAANHFRTSCQRVLDFLLIQIGSPLPADGQTMLTLATSKQLIASRIGMTPETLSRVLRDLTDAGLIVVDGRNIHLQNARIIRRMADAVPEQPLFPRRAKQRLPGLSATSRRGSPGATPGGAISIDMAINMAGRQRMLSQRMAKSWLLLGRGVQPGRSRKMLEQSTALFESQLDTLATVTDNDQIHTAHAAVGELWRPYRKLLESEPGSDGAKRLFDLNESMLAAAHDMTMTYEKAAATAKGHLINLAGRQRMLSQRMAKFYLFKQWDIHVDASEAGIAQAGAEFAAALGELVAAASNEPRIVVQLELVSQHWQLLQAALAATEPADPRRRAAIVATASERLLRQTEIAAGLYEELASH
ncbi:MAG: type IV pili methyl-accepting chemotaxis transducer N-terminal domain-containing protein [Gammaproteobacteria bacterium]|nr:type IV pili methyl-accepting chemotaxis transducer N-terminal domain-containing protein [Gammaproteobacteria bacterium]MBU1646664.1 type IV pili methyl-accepting chemotaxis transducer N-terminal domain-containing protein [Gammaproteobacteria bacterium]MBU1971697.1 type IV pili methyl-accepting chemotaxis transducer N-terminal domain-containing protein [Gammaproteobacteria bacterium]